MSVIAPGAWASPATYADHPQARAFVDRVSAEHGIESAFLEKLFEQARYQQSIVDAMNRPAERVKEWKDYRKIFLTSKRLRQGVKFWQDHRATLEKAQSEYGVPVEIIVAILGVETYYGRVTGGYRVIDALSTLAFDYPKRSAFFTRELEHFLLLTREQNLDPLTLTGSYAGAMGFGQFMPSSYRSYAVDFTGDGVADIWRDASDAIGSVANYFARHGWQSGGDIVAPAQWQGAVDDLPFNQLAKPDLTLAQLAEAGLHPVAEGFPKERKAIPLRLVGDGGDEFWLGFDNFYVVTRYNHSFRYAMAVVQLSEQLAARVNGIAP